MATLPPPVSPGDLVTSDLINQILASLRDLDQRLSNLEIGTQNNAAVVITSVTTDDNNPASVQGKVHINGRNFGPRGSNIVTFDNLPVATDVGSNDTTITVTVPPLSVLSGQGKIVTVSVSNSLGSASTQILVLPMVVTTPTGTLTPMLVSAPTGTLTAGQSFDFGFTINAITSLADDYLVTASIDSGWTAIVTLPAANAANDHILTIPKSDPPQGSSQFVSVSVAVPSSTQVTQNATLRLTVVSKLNPTGLRTVSAPIALVANGTPPPPAKIPVSFNPPVLISGGAVAAIVDAQGSTITLPTAAPGQYAVNFKVILNDPNGPYKVILPAAANGWAPQLFAPASGQIAVTQGQTNYSVRVGIQAPATTSSYPLKVRIEKVSDSTFFGETTVTLNHP